MMKMWAGSDGAARTKVIGAGEGVWVQCTRPAGKTPTSRGWTFRRPEARPSDKKAMMVGRKLDRVARSSWNLLVIVAGLRGANVQSQLVLVLGANTAFTFARGS
jgi:hypothetical protein